MEGASQVSLGAEKLCPSSPTPARTSVDPHVQFQRRRRPVGGWAGVAVGGSFGQGLRRTAGLEDSSGDVCFPFGPQ